jgi:cyclopropane fatty-acyl-phospholipid synthase-like methyltransferase
MNWIDLASCPLCGSDSGFTGFARHMSPFKAKDMPPIICSTYYTCNKCGLIFESPRPDDDYLRMIYEDTTYREGMTMNQESMDMGESARQARVAEYIPRGSKFLDIGCSRGYLLEIARRKLGCDILGVEPNASYPMPGIPTVRTLDEVTGTFDCISCIHVLEHVVDFKWMARRIVDLLNPGGTLLLEVPHAKSLGMVHIYVFTPAVIQRIFPTLTMVEYVNVSHHFMVFEKGREG